MDRKKRNESDLQVNSSRTDERNGMPRDQNPDTKPGRHKQPEVEKEALIVTQKGRKL